MGHEEAGNVCGTYSSKCYDRWFGLVPSSLTHSVFMRNTHYLQCSRSRKLTLQQLTDSCFVENECRNDLAVLHMVVLKNLYALLLLNA